MAVAVLGHLTADQGAPGLPAALGHAGDDVLDDARIESPDADVVEEEQRVGALDRDVVDAHGHEVDADRVEAARRLGDLQLRADTVGGADEDRLAGSRAGTATRLAEAADVGEHPGPKVERTWRLDPLDHLVGRVEARPPPRS